MNFRQGKTHWTHTSSILIGSGVRGGQVIGAYDDRCLSQPISLETGEITSSGTYLLPGIFSNVYAFLWTKNSLGSS